MLVLLLLLVLDCLLLCCCHVHPACVCVCRVAQFLAAGAAIPGFSPELYAGDAQYSPTLPSLVAGFGKTTLLDKLTVSAYNQGTAAFKDRYAKATKEPYAGHAAHAFDAATVLVQGYLADAKGGKPVAIASNASP